MPLTHRFAEVQVGSSRPLSSDCQKKLSRDPTMLQLALQFSSYPPAQNGQRKTYPGRKKLRTVQVRAINYRYTSERVRLFIRAQALAYMFLYERSQTWPQSRVEWSGARLEKASAYQSNKTSYKVYKQLCWNILNDCTLFQPRHFDSTKLKPVNCLLSFIIPFNRH